MKIKCHVIKKLNHFLLAITLLVLGIASSDAQVMFQHYYGTPTDGDYGRYAIERMGGGYALTGFTYSPSATADIDIMLIETDSCGYTVSDYALGGKREDGAFKILQKGNGNYIMGGASKSYTNGGIDMYITQFNAPTSTKALGLSIGGTKNDYGNYVSRTGDGGYILTGYTKSYGFGKEDVYLVRLDKKGSVLWAKAIGGAGKDVGNSVKETPDGGFIVVGETNSYSLDGSRDIYIIKTDASGAVLWSSVYGSPFAPVTDIAYDVEIALDGDYVLTGFATMDFYVGSPAFLSKDIFLMKISPAGVPVSLFCYSNPPFGSSPAIVSDDIGYNLTVTPDSGYAITGYSNAPTLALPFGTTDFQGIFLRIDPSGFPFAVQEYGMPGFDDKLFSIENTLDGGFIMAGQTQAYQSPGDYDAWLVKTDPIGYSGCNPEWFFDGIPCFFNQSVGDSAMDGHMAKTGAKFIPFNYPNDTICNYCDEIAVVPLRRGFTGTQQSFDIPLSAKLFPNPTEGNLNIELPLDWEGTTDVHVYDMQGRELLYFADITESISGNIPLNLSELQNGTYLMEIKNQDHVQVERLVIH